MFISKQNKVKRVYKDIYIFFRNQCRWKYVNIIICEKNSYTRQFIIGSNTKWCETCFKIFGVSEISTKITINLIKHNTYMKGNVFKGISWMNTFKKIGIFFINNKETSWLNIKTSSRGGLTFDQRKKSQSKIWLHENSQISEVAN